MRSKSMHGKIYIVLLINKEVLIIGTIVQVIFNTNGAVDVASLVQALVRTGSFASSMGRLFHYDGAMGYFKDVTQDLPNMAVHSHIVDQDQCSIDARIMARIIRDLIASPALLKKFEPAPHLINVLNGVIDIGTSNLLSHDKKYGFLYCRQFNYDAKADIKNAKQLIQFAKTSIGCDVSADTFTLLMQLIGYVISDRRDAKKAIFVYGASNTGKSLLLHLIESAFPLEDVSSVGLHELDAGFRFAELVDARVNILHEITPTRIKCVDTYKRVVSCEAVISEKKGKTPMRKVPRTVLVSATNMMPNFAVTELNDSLINRMLLLCFSGKLGDNQIDRDFLHKLVDEKDSIFSYAVAKFLPKLIKDNMHFIEPVETKRLIDGYSKDINSIRSFVDDECELVPEQKIFSKTLYDAYVKYAKENVLYEHDTLVFGTIIRGLSGVDNKKIRIGDKSCRGYQGIGLNVAKVNVDEDQVTGV